MKIKKKKIQKGIKKQHREFIFTLGMVVTFVAVLAYVAFGGEIRVGLKTSLTDALDTQTKGKVAEVKTNDFQVVQGDRVSIPIKIDVLGDEINAAGLTISQTPTFLSPLSTGFVEISTDTAGWSVNPTGTPIIMTNPSGSNITGTDKVLAYLNYDVTATPTAAEKLILDIEFSSVDASYNYTTSLAQGIEVNFTAGKENTPPTANAGQDQTVTAGDVVTLYGSGNDAETSNNDLIYKWEALGNPTNVSLSSDSVAQPDFTAPSVSGVYLFSLTVTDEKGDSATDDVEITIKEAILNNPPVANAGANRAVKVGTSVTLDGSASYDHEECPLPVGDSLDCLAYQWIVVGQPGGSNVLLPNKFDDQLFSKKNKTFEFTPYIVGTYTFRLQVRDSIDIGLGYGEVNIEAVEGDNIPPISNAGSLQTVSLNREVQLDGSDSLDPDALPAEVLTHQWRTISQPPGASIRLSDENIVNPTFTPVVPGNYTFGLVVTDADNEPSLENSTTVRVLSGHECKGSTADMASFDPSSGKILMIPDGKCDFADLSVILDRWTGNE
ncbi:MAG TPA: hypothetical protein ENI70_01885 [Candidatus Peregrinibacteria bacterium]|nr:hypothetical protein [Candidatus Peregrinibacteria bacterium]